MQLVPACQLPGVVADPCCKTVLQLATCTVSGGGGAPPAGAKLSRDGRKCLQLMLWVLPVVSQLQQVLGTA
jgi:hypothetical protein